MSMLNPRLFSVPLSPYSTLIMFSSLQDIPRMYRNVCSLKQRTEVVLPSLAEADNSNMFHLIVYLQRA